MRMKSRAPLGPEVAIYSPPAAETRAFGFGKSRRVSLCLDCLIDVFDSVIFGLIFTCLQMRISNAPPF